MIFQLTFYFNKLFYFVYQHQYDVKKVNAIESDYKHIWLSIM